jgi:hypothetical protein
MTELSTIKPEGIIKPKEIPKFSYHDGSYQSYIKEGFSLPEVLPDRIEREFLSKVDLKYGKIKIRIHNMIRQLAIDYSTDTEEKKEYLTFNTDWFAKDYHEEQIRGSGHIEGTYQQQVKKLVIKRNPITDQATEAVYERGEPRTVFNIPFSKKAVDSILFNEHPFGPDSLNVTDKARVLFYGKVEGTGLSPFRCAGYTYEQFVNTDWNEFVELAIRPGGPANRIPRKLKPQFIA